MMWSPLFFAKLLKLYPYRQRQKKPSYHSTSLVGSLPEQVESGTEVKEQVTWLQRYIEKERNNRASGFSDKRTIIREANLWRLIWISNLELVALIWLLRLRNLWVQDRKFSTSVPCFWIGKLISRLERQLRLSQLQNTNKVSYLGVFIFQKGRTNNRASPHNRRPFTVKYCRLTSVAAWTQTAGCGTSCSKLVKKAISGSRKLQAISLLPTHYFKKAPLHDT